LSQRQARREPEPGWFYSVEPRAKFKAADVLVQHGGRSKAQARSVLQKWQETGVMTSVACTTPTRNMTTKVVLNDAKVAEILAPLTGLGEAE
jgi:hypothetical protein